jgi:hypothetical protein
MIRTSFERRSTGFARRLAHHAQHAAGPGAVQALDQPCLPVLTRSGELDQQPVADTGGGAAVGLAVGHQHRPRRILAALGQLDVELAVGVAIDHVGHAHRRQVAGLDEAAAAAPAELTLVLKFLEHLAQHAALDALQAEGAGDVGLALFSRLREVADQGFPVGQTGGGTAGRAGHAL